MKTSNEHRCECSCHRVVAVHPTCHCSCGQPIVPPTKGCAPQRPTCPPPELPPQPGTVDVPQDQPPPSFTTSANPTGSATKPPVGSSAQVPWFTSQVNQIMRNGPTFGPRKDEFLPYLLVRSAAGDRGNRPFGGVFWESPDIFLSPNQEADTAPLAPATYGGVTQANAPTTLYAHVWNLGKAPAHRVRVEFYWFNPSLGIDRSDAHLIGAACVDLADRFTLSTEWSAVTKPYGTWLSHGNHAIVKCPMTWYPTFQNGGHECLVVRVLDPMFDAVDPNQFSSASDRHVAQRNIAVVQAASPASVDLALELGYANAPNDAEVDVSVDAPASMDWLQLYAGSRTPGYSSPTSAVVAGFLPPSVASTRTPSLKEIPGDQLNKILRPRERFARNCCPLQIAFHASAANLTAKQAQVLRVRQRVGETVVGGYTVVLIKP